jgi:DNA-binding transcriptional LysR family regulator
MLELEQLRVLVAVADRGSFAAAARVLERSTAAVSRTIAALEKQVGARLVERNTRSLRFTGAGQRFLDQARRVLDTLEQAVREAGEAHEELAGELGVTAPLMFGRLHVAPVVLAFLDRHPRVRVRTLFTDRTVSLLDSGMQVAVRIGELPGSSLRAVPVGQVRRVVVAAPSYLEKYGEPRVPEDLAQHRAIGFGHDVPLARWRFHDPARGVVEQARPAMPLIVDDQYTAVHAAIQGFGLATALSYQVREALLGGALRRVLVPFEPPPVPVHLVYLGGNHTPARVRAFVAFAAERLRGNPVLGV